MAEYKEPLFVDPVLLQQAEQLCQKRLRNDPEDRTVLRSLADVYRKQGNLGEVVVAYERLLRLDPQDREAGYLKAIIAGDEWPISPIGIRAAPFVYLKDFLARDFHEALLPFVEAVRDQFVPVLARDGDYKPDSRQALEFRGAWERCRFQQALVEVLPSVMPRLHLQPFKIGSIEMVVRAYQDGHYFKVHRDAPPGSPFANRIMNYVYYFHKRPRPYSGGELLLFDTDLEADTFTQSHFTRVVPEDNSIVLFPPNFYHCVVPIRCPSREFMDSRFVINGHVHQRMEAKPAVNDSIENVGIAAAL
jgi:hypothetical protein